MRFLLLQINSVGQSDSQWIVSTPNSNNSDAVGQLWKDILAKNNSEDKTQIVQEIVNQFHNQGLTKDDVIFLLGRVLEDNIEQLANAIVNQETQSSESASADGASQANQSTVPQYIKEQFDKEPVAFSYRGYSKNDVGGQSRDNYVTDYKIINGKVYYQEKNGEIKESGIITVEENNSGTGDELKIFVKGEEQAYYNGNLVPKEFAELAKKNPDNVFYYEALITGEDGKPKPEGHKTIYLVDDETGKVWFFEDGKMCESASITKDNLAYIRAFNNMESLLDVCSYLSGENYHKIYSRDILAYKTLLKETPLNRDELQRFYSESLNTIKGDLERLSKGDLSAEQAQVVKDVFAELKEIPSDILALSNMRLGNIVLKAQQKMIGDNGDIEQTIDLLRNSGAYELATRLKELVGIHDADFGQWPQDALLELYALVSQVRDFISKVERKEKELEPEQVAAFEQLKDMMNIAIRAHGEAVGHSPDAIQNEINQFNKLFFNAIYAQNLQQYLREPPPADFIPQTGLLLTTPPTGLQDVIPAQANPQLSSSASPEVKSALKAMETALFEGNKQEALTVARKALEELGGNIELTKNELDELIIQINEKAKAETKAKEMQALENLKPDLENTLAQLNTKLECLESAAEILQNNMETADEKIIDKCLENLKNELCAYANYEVKTLETQKEMLKMLTLDAGNEKYVNGKIEYYEKLILQNADDYNSISLLKGTEKLTEYNEVVSRFFVWPAVIVNVPKDMQNDLSILLPYLSKVEEAAQEQCELAEKAVQTVAMMSVLGLISLAEAQDLKWQNEAGYFVDKQGKEYQSALEQSRKPWAPILQTTLEEMQSKSEEPEILNNFLAEPIRGEDISAEQLLKLAVVYKNMLPAQQEALNERIDEIGSAELENNLPLLASNYNDLPPKLQEKIIKNLEKKIANISSPEDLARLAKIINKLPAGVAELLKKKIEQKLSKSQNKELIETAEKLGLIDGLTANKLSKELEEKVLEKIGNSAQAQLEEVEQR